MIVVAVAVVVAMVVVMVVISGRVMMVDVMLVHGWPESQVVRRMADDRLMFVFQKHISLQNTWNNTPLLRLFWILHTRLTRIVINRITPVCEWSPRPGRRYTALRQSPDYIQRGTSIFPIKTRRTWLHAYYDCHHKCTQRFLHSGKNSFCGIHIIYRYWSIEKKGGAVGWRKCD